MSVQNYELVRELREMNQNLASSMKLAKPSEEKTLVTPHNPLSLYY